MTQRSRAKNLLKRINQFRSDTFFISTGIPGLVGPLAAAANAAGGLKNLSVTANTAKKGAQTGCEICRSVCKPVDDLVGRPKPSSTVWGAPAASSARPLFAPAPQVFYPAPQSTAEIMANVAQGMPPVLDSAADVALMGKV